MAIETKKVPKTFGQTLREFQASIPEAFKKAATSDDEKDVAELEVMRNKIVSLGKLANEIRSAFDSLVDMRDQGMFGSDFAPDLERIRAKSENVGRPKKEKKDELASLDF